MNKLMMLNAVELLIEDVQSWGDYKNREMRRTNGVWYTLDVKLTSKINYHVDLDKILNAYPDFIKSKITDRFTPGFITQSIDYMYEDTREYLLRDYMHGCTISSNKYWTEEIDKCVKNVEYTTAYTLLQERTQESRINILKYWRARDSFKDICLTYIKNNTVGLYGRSGGHFCFMINDIKTILEELFDSIRDEDDDTTVYNNKNEKWLTYHHLRRIHHSCVHMIKEVDKMRKGINAQEHIKNEVADFVVEVKSDMEAERCSLEQDIDDIHNGVLEKRKEEQLHDITEKLEMFKKAINQQNKEV